MKINFTKIISSLAVCAMTVFAADAATFTAIASGAWSSSATWSGGTAPGINITGDDIIIGSGFIVDLDQDVTISSIVLVSGSLNVDGTLSSTTTGRTLTFTGGSLTGAGNIQVDRIRFQLSSTLGFTGKITANEMENTLSLVTSSQLKVNKTGRLLGSLTIGAGGKLELGDDATLTIEGGSVATSGNGSLSLSTTYNVIYQGGSSTSGSELSGSGLKNLTVDVGQGNSTSLGSDVNVKGTLSLTSGTLNMNEHVLNLNGDVAATGTGVIGSSNQSDLIIAGAASLTGSLRFASTANTVRNVTINLTGNGSYVALGSDLKISGILNLAGGSVRTGNYTLDIMTTGSITGASKDNYIVTGASGKLGFMLTGSGNFTNYPIGTQDRYAPAAARIVTGTNGMVRINAINEVYSEGTTGSDMSTTEKMVKGSWNIASDITSGLNLDVKLMWAASSEVNSFNRSSSYISHYTASDWDVMAGAAATAEANGMFSVTRTGLTSLSPFSVRQGTNSGVADIARLNSISVYPNPANDYIIINNTENVNVEIMNQLGQVVKTEALNGSAPLNLSDLDRGNYFIKISSDNASVVKKFVKL
ncbi:MAG: T9SS type A sorting domain-containing protein [Bacteroidota bacterium]